MSLFVLRCGEDIQLDWFQAARRFVSLYSLHTPTEEERGCLITLANLIKYILIWIDFDFNVN